MVKNELYPAEICHDVNSIDTDEAGYLMSDPLFLHCMLFSTEAYYDERLGRKRSALTDFHFMKAIRLLQERISEPNSPLAIADHTIMTVVILGLTADLFDDQVSVEHHMDGLRKMVVLRGGFASMSSAIHDLQAKICRFDILCHHFCGL